MTAPQSPTTEAQEATPAMVLAALDAWDSSSGNDWGRMWNAIDAALEALSRPSPVALLQDSDAGHLRYIAAVLRANANKFAVPDHIGAQATFLERIAARLEAPIAEDALVEARDLAGHLKAIRDFAVFATDHASALASKADDVLAAIHEKKG